MNTTVRSSAGSTQNTVLAAPPQPNSPPRPDSPPVPGPAPPTRPGPARRRSAGTRRSSPVRTTPGRPRRAGVDHDPGVDAAGRPGRDLRGTGMHSRRLDGLRTRQGRHPQAARCRDRDEAGSGAAAGQAQIGAASMSGVIKNFYQTCGVRPPAMREIPCCFECWPGGPVTPPPCRRCGSKENYYTSGLCARCHDHAPGPKEKYGTDSQCAHLRPERAGQPGRVVPAVPQAPQPGRGTCGWACGTSSRRRLIRRWKPGSGAMRCRGSGWNWPVSGTGWPGLRWRGCRVSLGDGRSACLTPSCPRPAPAAAVRTRAAGSRCR
jgi:hypothetical protein